MKQKRVLYIVSREANGRLSLDGGLETNQLGAPDTTVRLGDTIYHVLLRTTQGAPVVDSVRQTAIAQVPDVLRERPDDFDALY